MAAPDKTVEIVRGPDGDTVMVNGVTIDGAYLMFQDALRVVIAIPAGEVYFRTNARPSVRRIALEE